jgi:LacI family transcriptional regulator, fructose operon transcriptional repressor
VTPKTSSKRTTIYDLAALAGTSASAVSAVMNGNWQKRRISAALAEKVTRIAEEQGYALNLQASLLRREKSRIIGMIVPKYDNRYFGSIAEGFEVRAREVGLFPIVTCTQRDPSLEIEAAKTMLSYQVDCLIACGATDPDRITELCAQAGVRSINLDLPGKLAPSVISDNYLGAHDLTARVLTRCREELDLDGPLLFVGGRSSDHNTSERIRGFRAAHAEVGIEVPAENILTCGYAADKAAVALTAIAARTGSVPRAMFVNSTITLEGVVRWLKDTDHLAGYPARLGCFDWDPFAALLYENIEMVRQDVPQMLAALFKLIETRHNPTDLITVPPILEGNRL